MKLMSKSPGWVRQNSEKSMIKLFSQFIKVLNSSTYRSTHKRHLGHNTNSMSPHNVKNLKEHSMSVKGACFQSKVLVVNVFSGYISFLSFPKKASF